MVYVDENYSSLDSMLELYIFETKNLLEQLEEILLISEKNLNISKEDIDEIFRIMHTIKGSSAMMMFQNVANLAHCIEDLFHYIRENDSTNLNCSSLCDIVFKSLDFIKTETIKIENGQVPEADENEMVLEIEDLLEKLKGVEGIKPNLDIESLKISEINNAIREHNKKEYDQIRKEEKENDDYNLSDFNLKYYNAKVYFEDDCKMENIRAYTIVNNLNEFCDEMSQIPDNILEDNEASGYIAQNGFELFFSSYNDFSDIQKVFDEALFVKSYEIRPNDNIVKVDLSVQDCANDIEQESGDAVLINNQNPKMDGDLNTYQSSKGTKQSIISVNIQKLDMLLDLVGEIVITESMVIKNPDLEGLELDNFNKSARQLVKLTDELQDVVMSIRMIPIATTFHKMNRIVRDMSKRLSKDTELIILGEETEVDKNIIDHLSDPLMHLIRNAMDHGIEDEDERIKNGKSNRGKIVLEAQNTGGDVIIKVRDDGRGIEKEKIIAKALSNGLITKTEAELTDKEIFSLVLLPGFSTNESVTEYSGRGVGMDVVKKNIEKVGGSISIDSVVNVGTTVTIKIPLTLAIVDGMQVSVGNSMYTIPTLSIRESFKAIKDDYFIDTEGNEMIMIRGECHPILRLHKFFGIKTDIQDISEGILVVVEADSKAVCLFSDSLIGEQQVVVKSLPPYLLNFSVKESGIGGCTILGNGEISLILDALGIINRVIS